MRMVDLIAKKRDGYELTESEIRFLIRGYTDGSIPDYQMSAWAMAVSARRMPLLRVSPLKNHVRWDLDFFRYSRQSASGKNR